MSLCNRDCGRSENLFRALAKTIVSARIYSLLGWLRLFFCFGILLLVMAWLIQGYTKKLVFDLSLRSPFTIFAHSSHADVSFVETGGWGTTYLLERRLLDALILTNRNFATFKSCHRQSNGRCSRGVYITPLVLPVFSREVLVYTYRRGLLRCSF